jgi:hypothetical protein
LLPPTDSAVARESAGKDRALELVTVFLMSLMVVLTAWTGFQSTHWSSVQAEQYSRATAARTESVRASNTAGQQIALDVAVFIAWTEAYAEGDARRADFVYERFPDRLRPAADAWVALDPLDNPDAPATPFEMDEYVVPAVHEADEWLVEADESLDDASAAGTNTSSYVATTVVFAAVLFFAGMSVKLTSRRNRMIVMVLAGIGTVAGIVRLLTLPIEL